jgi:hypothetical protein
VPAAVEPEDEQRAGARDVEGPFTERDPEEVVLLAVGHLGAEAFRTADEGDGAGENATALARVR